MVQVILEKHLLITWTTRFLQHKYLVQNQLIIFFFFCSVNSVRQIEGAIGSRGIDPTFPCQHCHQCTRVLWRGRVGWDFNRCSAFPGVTFSLLSKPQYMTKHFYSWIQTNFCKALTRIWAVCFVQWNLWSVQKKKKKSDMYFDKNTSMYLRGFAIFLHAFIEFQNS